MIDPMMHNQEEHNPISPIGRYIPINYEGHRPRTHMNIMEYARGGGVGAGSEEFDAGMGGRASQGANPQDALRRQREETEYNAVNILVGSRPPRERSLEDYPSLPVVSSAQQSRLGSSKSSTELNKITGGGSDESILLSHMTMLGVIKEDKRLQNRAKGTTKSTTSTQAPQPAIKYYCSAVASKPLLSSQSSSSSSSNWLQPHTIKMSRQSRYASHLHITYCTYVYFKSWLNLGRKASR